MDVSRRMQAVQAPVIPVVGDLVASTPGTISLGQGVVSFGPPPQALAAIERFAADPANHRYQHGLGIAPLRDALARKHAGENGVEPGRYVVAVTAGGNMAFLSALYAIADPGDEVILPRPYFFNHEMAVRIAGCEPVIVPTGADYQLDLAAIEAAMGPRTRAVVSVSPNNPTGAVYPEAALRDLNALCARRGVYHVSDEVYEYFTWDDARHFSPAAIAGAQAHTIAINSFSKAYGFASWRIGWMLLPEHLLEAFQKVQDTNVICAPVVSQYAALGLLEVGRAHFEHHRPRLAAVRSLMLEALAALGNAVTVPRTEGAFYFLVGVHGARDPMRVTERLVREHRVAVIPGSAFGADDGCRLRIGFGALDEATAREGLDRLVAGLRAVVG